MGGGAEPRKGRRSAGRAFVAVLTLSCTRFQHLSLESKAGQSAKRTKREEASDSESGSQPKRKQKRTKKQKKAKKEKTARKQASGMRSKPLAEWT